MGFRAIARGYRLSTASSSASRASSRDIDRLADKALGRSVPAIFDGGTDAGTRG